MKVLIKSLILLQTPFIKSNFGPMRGQLLTWSLLIGQKLDLIKGVRSKIKLYMRNFNIISDPTQIIYQELIVFDGSPNFHLGQHKTGHFEVTTLYIKFDRN